MIKKNPFLLTDSEFKVYINKALSYLEKNYIRLQIPKSRLAASNIQKKSWETYYDLIQQQKIKISCLTEEKNNIRTEIEIQLRLIYGNLLQNMLTRNDFETLQLHRLD